MKHTPLTCTPQVLHGTGILDVADLKSLDWHVLLLLGGGSALGRAIRESGLLHEVGDTIVWAMGGGWALLVGVLAYVTYHADDPGMPVVIFAVTIAAGAVGLVTVVMRSLLRRAARLRTDMDAVI